jgi:membrane protease YdiL (CAAX protease family)
MFEQMVIYFPVCFILDEVVFRGMLDSHLCGKESSAFNYWASAVFVSLLWGAWHLPIIEMCEHVVRNATNLMVFHMIVGVPLSICWRRSGTLALPAAAHALIFAFRSAIFP